MLIAAITGSIAAIASIFAAVNTLLSRRERYELPVIRARVRESHTTTPDGDLVRRTVQLVQLTEPPGWHLNNVRIQNSRKQWLAEIGEGERDSLGGIIRNNRKGEWTHRVEVNPPAVEAEFFIHPEAPTLLWFSIGVALRGKPNIKRRMVVSSE